MRPDSLYSTTQALKKAREAEEKLKKDFKRIDAYRKAYPEADRLYPDDMDLAEAVYKESRKYYQDSSLGNKDVFINEFLLPSYEIPEAKAFPRVLKDAGRVVSLTATELAKVPVKFYRFIDDLTDYPINFVMNKLGFSDAVNQSELVEKAQREKTNYNLGQAFGIARPLGIDLEGTKPQNLIDYYYSKKGKGSFYDELNGLSAEWGEGRFSDLGTFLKDQLPFLTDKELEEILSEKSKGRSGDATVFDPSIQTNYGDSFLEAAMTGKLNKPVTGTAQFIGKEVIPFISSLLVGKRGADVALKNVPVLGEKLPRWFDKGLNYIKKTSPTAKEKAAEKLAHLTLRKGKEGLKFLGRQPLRAFKEAPSFMLSGELTGQMFFDPYEDRLVNIIPDLIEKDEYFGSDIVQFLTAEEGKDTVTEARIKMALENLILYPAFSLTLGTAGTAGKTAFEVLKGVKAGGDKAIRPVLSRITGKSLEAMKKTQDAKVNRMPLDPDDMDTMFYQFSENSLYRNLTNFWLNTTNPRGSKTPYQFGRDRVRIGRIRKWNHKLKHFQYNLDNALDDAVISMKELIESGKAPSSLIEELSEKSFVLTSKFLEFKSTPQVERNLFRVINQLVGAKRKDGVLINKTDKELFAVLPENLQGHLIKARKYIDELSAHISKSKTVSPEVKSVVENNVGSYLRKAYRLFDEPGYVPSQEAQNNFINYLKLNKKFSQEEAEFYVKDMINNRANFNAFIGFTGQAAKLNREIFKQRKDLDSAVEDFLGPIKDPKYNITNTITRMVNFVENDKFLSDVLDEGVDKIFFKTRQSKVFTERLNSNPDAVLNPGQKTFKLGNQYGALEGYYTSPNTKKVFEEILKLNRPHLFGQGDVVGDVYHGLLQSLLMVKGIVNWNMTIGNNITHERNFLSGIPFMLANGNIPAGKNLNTSIKTIINEIRKKPDNDKLKLYNDLVEKGVINTQVSAGELNALFDDLSTSFLGRSANKIGNVLTDHAEKKFGKSLNDFAGIKVPGTRQKIKDVPQDLYLAEDDIWKITSYLAELKTLQKAYGNTRPLNELKDEAALIVKNTIQNYDYVPPNIKALRKFPLFGVFFSFPTEMMRTTFNIFKQATKELNSNNPVIVNKGVRRMAGGASIIGGGGAALSEVSKMLYGITDEQEAAIREISRPDYSKHSPHIYTISSEGKLLAQDTGHFDPYDLIRRPFFTAFVEFQDGHITGRELKDTINTIAAEAITDSFRPFLGTPLATELALTAITGQTDTGNIYPDLDADPIGPKIFQGDNLKRLMDYLIPRVLPQVIPNIGRVFKAFNEEIKPSGQTYDIETELTANLMGIRRNEVDPLLGFQYRISELARIDRNINSAFNYSYRLGTKPEEFFDSYKKYDADKYKNDQRIAKAIDAALTLGLDRTEIDKILKETGAFTKAERDKFIYENKYSPLSLTAERKVKINNSLYPDTELLPLEFSEKFNSLYMKNFGRTLLANPLMRTDLEDRETFDYVSSTEIENYRKRVEAEKRRLPKVTGGLVSGPDVPQTKENPADRINPITDEPYQEQMDRLGFAEGEDVSAKKGPPLHRKIYALSDKMKEYMDYYGLSKQEVLARHNEWNAGKWKNIFQKIGFNVNNDYELNRLYDYATGKDYNEKEVKKYLDKYNLEESSNKKIIDFINTVRPDESDKGFYESGALGELVPYLKSRLGFAEGEEVNQPNYLYNNMGNIESRYDYWAGKTDDVYYKKGRKKGYLGFDSRIAGIRAPLRDFNNKLERYKDTEDPVAHAVLEYLGGGRRYPKGHPKEGEFISLEEKMLVAKKENENPQQYIDDMKYLINTEGPQRGIIKAVAMNEQTEEGLKYFLESEDDILTAIELAKYDIPSNMSTEEMIEEYITKKQNNATLH